MEDRYTGKLLSNFIALSIVQGTNFLLPLLVMPYVISKIGPSGFGVIALAQAVMVYLSAISDYGFNLSATREIAYLKDDYLKISQVFSTVLATRLLITAFLFVVFLIAGSFITMIKDHFILYLLGFSCVAGQALLVSWFFQGKEKMHYITVSTLMARLLFVVLVFLFIRGKADGIYFLFFLGLGNSIAGLFSIYLARRIFKVRLLKPYWRDIVYELQHGWQVTFSNLSISTYLYSGIFILRILTNDTVVGYYSIAERIFFAVRQVLAIFSQVVYPHICQLTHKGKAATTAFFKKLYLPFLWLMIAGCLLLFIIAPQVVHVFIKGNTAIPASLLRMLSFVPVIVCLNIPAYQLLVAFDYKKSYLKVFGLATIVNIGLNILLVKSLGATGTALSIILTEVFITTGLTRALYKNEAGGYLITNTE